MKRTMEKWKRICSVLLCMVLCMSNLPVAVQAEITGSNSEQETKQENVELQSAEEGLEGGTGLGDTLAALLAEANALDEDKYSDETYRVLEEAMLAAEALSEEATQEEIDAAIAAIQLAMDGLAARYPNLALGKSVTASSTYPTATFATEHAVDGDTQTRWGNAYKSDSYKAGNHEETYTVNLGDVYPVDMISINWEAAYASSYTIQGSVDGESYFDIKDITAGNGAVEVWDALGDVSAQYIRLALHEAKTQYGYSIWELEVYEKNPNAKNYDNLALGKDVTVSGLEVSDGRWTADKAVDGIVSTDSRVSFARDKDEQWMLIDLGARKTVSRFVINYESLVPAFKIQVSTDGVNYTDVYEIAGLPDAGPTKDSIQDITIEPVKARYIKYVQLKRWNHATNGKVYSGSIYEFEVYKNTMLDAEYALNQVKEIAPTIENGKLILPEVPAGFAISLYGSDNQQVVAMDGTVTAPLQDMDVNVLYQVVNTNNPEDAAYSEDDINFIVPGQYEAFESINEKPAVMPGLREWKGNEGDFTLTENSKIVVTDTSLEETAKQIQFYLSDMLGRDLAIAVEGETSGDIVLVKDSAYASLGSEGYVLEIDDIIYIKSDSAKGILYGGISITQILSQDEEKDNVPKGIARDYPKYEVRSGMIDAGRTYIPMDYLREMSIYMAYYKLNEIHVHINDYWSATNYSAFRLESETYPEITATDGSYTKEEYRQYQIDMKKYGIDVVTEIDTPYHAECFRNVDGVVMLKKGALDIRDASSYTIIENVLDEYLDGENPVIQSDKFHIGTDEYDKAYSEEMRAWTDHFIKYVNAKGYETRLWGSLGSRGFDGETEVSSEATMNIWAPYWADVKEMYGEGYDIINTCGGYLYIVPGANAGYPDRLDIANLYDIFEVYDFAPTRQYGNGTAVMPVAHPQTKGAEFALWNDMTSYGGGFSWFDLYDRFKDGVMIISEKTWYGEKTEGQTAEEFMSRVEALGDIPAGANPGRYVASETDVIAEIDFETVVDQKAADVSGNAYDAELVNVTLEEVKDKTVATVAGDGYVSMPFDSVGYPYTVMVDVKLSEDTADQTEIFSGHDGVLYADINGTGKIGYARGSYQFMFDYELPLNRWVTLTLTCDETNTTLYVDGEKISVGNNMAAAISNRKDSTTFILPVEKILGNATGSLDNLKLYNRVLSEEEITASFDYVELENLALKKNITASSTYPDARFVTAHAVDGDVETRWGNNYKSDSYKAGNVEETVTVDLGNAYQLDKLIITFEAAYASKYVIQGSLDGDTFFDIKTVTDGKVGENLFRGLDTETRYIRLFLQTPATQYGYSIYEIEAYQSATQQLKNVVAALAAKMAEIEVGTSNGCMLEEDYQKYMQVIESARALLEDHGAAQIDIHEEIRIVTAALERVDDDILSGLFEIVKQPESVGAVKGADAVVTIEATGNDLTYTWYYKNPGNKKFYESGSEFVSEDGTAYTIPMYAWRDGQEVYCVVTDISGATIQSNTVTLTMTEETGSIVIVEQPKDVTVISGYMHAVVTVKATGNDLTYTWYYKNPGNVKFYESGADFVNNYQYMIEVAPWRDGQQVYCVITDANGDSVQTNTVTLTIK